MVCPPPLTRTVTVLKSAFPRTAAPPFDAPIFRQTHLCDLQPLRAGSGSEVTSCVSYCQGLRAGSVGIIRKTLRCSKVSTTRLHISTYLHGCQRISIYFPCIATQFLHISIYVHRFPQNFHICPQNVHTFPQSSTYVRTVSTDFHIFPQSFIDFPQISTSFQRISRSPPK